MPTDPKAQVEAQLRRIEEALGKTASDVADEVGRQGIERHSEVVAFLKATHGLTHGNANLLATWCANGSRVGLRRRKTCWPLCTPAPRQRCSRPTKRLRQLPRAWGPM